MRKTILICICAGLALTTVAVTMGYLHGAPGVVNVACGAVIGHLIFRCGRQRDAIARMQARLDRLASHEMELDGLGSVQQAPPGSPSDRLNAAMEDVRDAVMQQVRDAATDWRPQPPVFDLRELQEINAGLRGPRGFSDDDGDVDRWHYPGTRSTITVWRQSGRITERIYDQMWEIYESLEAGRINTSIAEWNLKALLEMNDMSPVPSAASRQRERLVQL